MKELKVHDTKCDQELKILIGENAKDNWKIIDLSSQFDIWFHVENHPSCHVILQLPDKNTEYNKQSLIHCANLCKQNSKFKDLKKVTIIYTEIKNITKGKDPGSVILKKQASRIVL
jgi:predicted ribosome quality control (RQC) complex YloA/Tae2 family protein